MWPIYRDHPVHPDPQEPQVYQEGLQEQLDQLVYRDQQTDFQELPEFLVVLAPCQDQQDPQASLEYQDRLEQREQQVEVVEVEESVHQDLLDLLAQPDPLEHLVQWVQQEMLDQWVQLGQLEPREPLETKPVHVTRSNTAEFEILLNVVTCIG